MHCQRAPRKSKPVLDRHLVKYKRHHRLWRYYGAHPMPYCTWANESGALTAASPEWPPSPRYSVIGEAGGGAGGKYQVIPSTLVRRRRHRAPLPAGGERAAALAGESRTQRVGPPQGLGAWVNC